MSGISQIQLGKNGITPNFMESLKNRFKNVRTLKISVLKSAGHDKQMVKEFSKKILKELGENYTAKIIGFTIAIKKWRNPRTQ